MLIYKNSSGAWVKKGLTRDVLRDDLGQVVRMVETEIEVPVTDPIEMALAMAADARQFYQRRDDLAAERAAQEEIAKAQARAAAEDEPDDEPDDDDDEDEDDELAPGVYAPSQTKARRRLRANLGMPEGETYRPAASQRKQEIADVAKKVNAVAAAFTKTMQPMLRNMVENLRLVQENKDAIFRAVRRAQKIKAKAARNQWRPDGDDIHEIVQDGTYEGEMTTASTMLNDDDGIPEALKPEHRTAGMPNFPDAEGGPEREPMDPYGDPMTDASPWPTGPKRWRKKKRS